MPERPELDELLEHIAFILKTAAAEQRKSEAIGTTLQLRQKEEIERMKNGMPNRLSPDQIQDRRVHCMNVIVDALNSICEEI